MSSSDMVNVDPPDLNLMRKSGSILAETLRYLSEDYNFIDKTPLKVSLKAEEIIRSFDGATPAFLGYKGFTGTACVSVNEQVVHGVPKDCLVLKSGDIVSIDLGVLFEGHYTDACRTISIGEVSSHIRKLIKVTKDSLDKGIEAARIGNRIGDISYAIQRVIERKGFSVSRDFVGHGIGRVLHGSPCVPNYGPPGVGEEIYDGLCLAIEPVVFDGPTAARLLQDNWTVVSLHGNLSAHFEDTIIVTKDGPEIITRKEGNRNEKT